MALWIVIRIGEGIKSLLKYLYRYGEQFVLFGSPGQRVESPTARRAGSVLSLNDTR